MPNLAEKLSKISLEGNPSDKRTVARTLPDSPGCYVYFRGSEVIYIGKAISLKKRVTSYFDLDLEPKTAKMISEADAVGVVKVTSELEALLLEARLIRSYMPHYNIEAKDDKHPLYIVITKEKYPRVITARKLEVAGKLTDTSFGPFPNSANVKTVLRMIRRVFPFSDHKLGKRGCLYSHIGLCNPCPSEVENLKTEIEKNDKRKIYLKNLRRIKNVLSGKFDGVKEELTKEMGVFSKNEKYEEATEIRNKISSLDYITQPQMPSEFYIENPNLYEDQRNRELKELNMILRSQNLTIPFLKRIECFDIAHLAGTNPTASMVTFVQGEADKNYYRHFKIKKAKGGDDYESMREVARRRATHFDDWGKPDLIIVDGGKGQVKAFTSVVPVVGIAKHPDRLIVGEMKVKLTGGALNLVSRMRDEAHRFARRLHHKLVSKEFTSKK